MAKYRSQFSFQYSKQNGHAVVTAAAEGSSGAGSPSNFINGAVNAGGGAAAALPSEATAADRQEAPNSNSLREIPGKSATISRAAKRPLPPPNAAAGGHVNILNGVGAFAENMGLGGVRGIVVGGGVVDAVTRTCELGNVRAPKELWLV